jgi:hypothetical protein
LEAVLQHVGVPSTQKNSLHKRMDKTVLSGGGRELSGLAGALSRSVGVSNYRGRQFEAAGLKRKHLSSAGPIRTIFRKAFREAWRPNFTPNSFRNTLVHLGETVCQTPEQFKAWSQNLGHEGVLTTFYSYGEVSNRRQQEMFEHLQSPQSPTRGRQGGMRSPTHGSRTTQVCSHAKHKGRHEIVF